MKLDIIPDNFLRCMSAEDRQALGSGILTLPEIAHKNQCDREKELQRLVSQYLGTRDVPFLWQAMHRRATGMPGTPDFVWCYRGRFCAAECKTDEGSCTDEQVTFLKRIHSSGGAAIVARSVAEVVEVFRAVDKACDGQAT